MRLFIILYNPPSSLALLEEQKFGINTPTIVFPFHLRQRLETCKNECLPKQIRHNKRHRINQVSVGHQLSHYGWRHWKVSEILQRAPSAGTKCAALPKKDNNNNNNDIMSDNEMEEMFGSDAGSENGENVAGLFAFSFHMNAVFISHSDKRCVRASKSPISCSCCQYTLYRGK